MNRPIPHRHKPIPATLATTLLAIMTGAWTSTAQAALGREPRLLSDTDAILMAPSPSGEGLACANAGDIDELQRSLQSLAISADLTTQDCKEWCSHLRTTPGVDATRGQAMTVEPRLKEVIDQPLTPVDAIAFVTQVPSDFDLAWQSGALNQSTQDSLHKEQRHTALQNTSGFNAPDYNNKHSKEFQVFAKIGPQLTDNSMTYPQAADEITPAFENRTINGASSEDEQQLVRNTPKLTGASNQSAELSINDAQFTTIELDGTELASLEHPVSADQLQETRAGFMLNNGVQVDFSITRLTTIGGIEQFQTLVHLPKSPDQSTLAEIVAGQAGSPQVPVLTDGSAILTIVQNNQDNQNIRDVTTLDIDIKNFGLRSLDFVPSNLRRDAVPAVFR